MGAGEKGTRSWESKAFGRRMVKVEGVGGTGGQGGCGGGEQKEC